MNGWRDAPAKFELGADTVHLWRLRLEGEEAPARRQLTADELARADRFRVEGARRQFVLARAGLRSLLGQYLGSDPGALGFADGPHGKPRLAAPAGDLRFNVSHSGGVALVAVARGVEVGADVELHRANLDVDGMAPRLCTPAELEALRALAPEQRRVAFFGLWTCKEALLKALGTGLSLPLQRIEVSVPCGPAPRRVILAPASGASQLFQVRAIDIGHGISAAVAHEGMEARLALYEALTG